MTDASTTQAFGSVLSPLTAPVALVQRLSESVQPVVFETNIPETPYSTVGTAFYVGWNGRAFVVMARHTLHPDELNPLCFFPSDSSRRLLPLTSVYYVPAEAEGEESLDLAIIEIDMKAAMMDSELVHTRLIDLNLAVPHSLPSLPQASLFLVGYPEDQSLVNYETEELQNQRIVLHGRYVGPTSPPYVHQMEIAEVQGLSSFSGLSGSPVFTWHQDDQHHGQVTLCGMAISGTPSSGCVHFLDAAIIRSAFEVLVGPRAAASKPSEGSVS